MSVLSRIWFPVAVVGATIAGVVSESTAITSYRIPEPDCLQDTVVYTQDAYKIGRVGNFDAAVIADSLLDSGSDSTEVLDTLPHLTARDTIKAPDSLRFTDPFRYKYYVALIDSLTHRIVVDSLRAAGDSIDCFKVDSIYLADSASRAQAKYLQWYNSLSKKERRKVDYEKMIPIRQAELDSLKKAKEDRQALKDSITENTPRILETFVLPDSMFYKRIITWTVDQDFHDLKVEIPDTSYNYRFHDYPFLRKDVNAVWLGVAGSPMMYYDFMQRDQTTRQAEFYKTLSPWSYSPSTVQLFNSKTPHTELAYFGTLMAGDENESDNLHIFTTQNITPAFNFSLLYDRFGGGGMLNNEETKNKNFAATANYLGKNYAAHGGYLWNKVLHEENWGMKDPMWVRDTTVNSREIPVNSTTAKSETKKNTLFLDQQYRIPFDFINTIKAKMDTTFVADSNQTDITTAFIGHSSEFTRYTRKYTDGGALDSLANTVFDNKVFIRLQPWSDEGIISKLDIGLGDYLNSYYKTAAADTGRVRENSMYVYAGAKGQYKKYLTWQAKASYVFAGHDFGDTFLGANATVSLYPFRRYRNSPMLLGASFSESLTEPNYYQRHMYTNLYKWDGSFSKTSTTKLEGSLSIPRWKLDSKIGYALLGGNIYYDELGQAKQNARAMSVFSASVRKEFVVANFLHLDNRILVQHSTNQEVLPLPTVAANARWFIQFVVQRDESKTHNVMEMQLGVDAYCNTPWYAPAWNPVTGTYHNQTETKYTNGPYFDAFMNVQWKRACIFVKYENAGQGWPLKHADYFASDRYIVTQRGVKFGLFWPFYIQPGRNSSVGSRASGGGSSESMGGESAGTRMKR